MNFKIKHFICISLCFFFICMSFYSKPKEVKAFGLETIPLVAGGTVLGPGAVVLLGVVSACGIALCNEDVRDFVTDCGTYCYDELSKIKATYDESLNGINAELTPSLIEKVLEFAKSKEGTSFVPATNIITPINGFYELPFSVSSTSDVPVILSVLSLKNTNGSIVSFPVYYSDGVTFTRQNLQVYSREDVTLNICTKFEPSYGSNLYDLYASTTTNYNTDFMFSSPTLTRGSYILKIPESVTDFVSVSSLPFTYPDILKNGCKSIDEYNDKYKEYTGINSVCADLTKLGGLALDSSIDDVCIALEGTLPVYSDDVIGTSDIPGISIENDGVNTKVDDIPDTSTKDETGVLGSILEWIKSLLLSLFKFLEGLLQKLIELLRDLLVSLFVPSDAFVQEKVDTLKNQLEPKLPYAQYIKLFDSSYEGNELKDIIINIYGQDVVIVKVTLFEHFRDLFNTGVYAVMFFLLAVYNYNNIYKLVRGTDYVSATNTINNATGGIGGSGKGGGD